MTDNMGFVVAVAFKWLAVLGLGFFSYDLMLMDKDGWGWLVFLAVLASCTSYKTTSTEKPDGIGAHKEGD